MNIRTNNDSLGKLISPSEVQFRRVLPGPIELVWEFLTESEKRGTWFSSGKTERRVGGTVQFHFLHSSLTPIQEPTPEKFKDMENGVSFEGKVLAYDPPRFLSYTWGDGSEVSFELIPEGKDVLLILTHTKLPNSENRIRVSAGWHAHLGILVSKMEGTAVPAFWSNFLKNEKIYEEL